MTARTQDFSTKVDTEARYGSILAQLQASGRLLDLKVKDFEVPESLLEELVHRSEQANSARTGEIWISYYLSGLSQLMTWRDDVLERIPGGSVILTQEPGSHFRNSDVQEVFERLQYLYPLNDPFRVVNVDYPFEDDAEIGHEPGEYPELFLTKEDARRIAGALEEIRKREYDGGYFKRQFGFYPYMTVMEAEALSQPGGPLFSIARNTADAKAQAELALSKAVAPRGRLAAELIANGQLAGLAAEFGTPAEMMNYPTELARRFELVLGLQMLANDATGRAVDANDPIPDSWDYPLKWQRELSTFHARQKSELTYAMREGVPKLKEISSYPRDVAVVFEGDFRTGHVGVGDDLPTDIAHEVNEALISLRASNGAEVPSLLVNFDFDAFSAKIDRAHSAIALHKEPFINRRVVQRGKEFSRVFLALVDEGYPLAADMYHNWASNPEHLEWVESQPRGLRRQRRINVRALSESMGESGVNYVESLAYEMNGVSIEEVRRLDAVAHPDDDLKMILDREAQLGVLWHAMQRPEKYVNNPYELNVAIGILDDPTAGLPVFKLDAGLDVGI